MCLCISLNCWFFKKILFHPIKIHKHLNIRRKFNIFSWQQQNLNKLGIEGHFLNLINGIFEKESACFPGNSAGKESACNSGDPGSIPGLRRSPGKGYATHASILGLPGGSTGKESARNVGDLGLIPGLGRDRGRGHSDPLQYSCLENPHRQRSLEGYNPWGHKELDMTERFFSFIFKFLMVKD